MIETGQGVDWAFAEALAFGSLLVEVHNSSWAWMKIYRTRMNLNMVIVLIFVVPLMQATNVGLGLRP